MLVPEIGLLGGAEDPWAIQLQKRMLTVPLGAQRTPRSSGGQRGECLVHKERSHLG